MGIPNVKRFRVTSPDGNDTATMMAVVPKGTDLNSYLKEASTRFDWKSWNDAYRLRVNHADGWIDQPRQSGSDVWNGYCEWQQRGIVGWTRRVQLPAECLVGVEFPCWNGNWNDCESWWRALQLHFAKPSGKRD